MSAHVVKGTVHRLGGCTFCGERSQTVYQIEPRGIGGMIVRMCPTCLGDVMRQARGLGFRTTRKAVSQ